MNNVTEQLNAEGGPRFENALYVQLHTLAAREMRRMGSRRTLNAAALVNEAWIKSASVGSRWESRAHFLSSMAKVMRHVLVDYAREQGALRRGGAVLHITLDELAANDLHMEASELLEIDQILTHLSQAEPRLEHVVELRFFAGLTITETANTLGISEPTVKRDLRAARAFIASRLDKVKSP